MQSLKRREELSAHTRTRLIWRNGKKVRAHRWLMEQHLDGLQQQKSSGPMANGSVQFAKRDHPEELAIPLSIETARRVAHCHGTCHYLPPWKREATALG